MTKRNNKGQFKKGITPWNKGKKGINLGGEKGWFKKGQQPVSTRPIGAERIDKDGIVQIKVTSNKWMSKHRHLYEQANGPVPKGHVIIFANGNRRDFDVNNLICVSRKQLAIINKNKLITNDIDVTKTGVTIAELLLRIGEREKENNN